MYFYICKYTRFYLFTKKCGEKVYIFVQMMTNVSLNINNWTNLKCYFKFVQL